MQAKSLRRDDRALSQDVTVRILEKGEYGILSTVSSDGQPYGVPFSYVYADNRLYFHCAVEGHKLENLTANPRVSFCVVGETEVLPDKFATRYESAIAFGQAVELFGDDKLAALTEVLKKYSPDFLEKGQRYIESDAVKTRVYKIEIEALSGKSRK
ncbi:MAG: pyridoxamine 5'-phosphate oxidase family protein [Chloroflexi bacterium]|nr:pyridoxamine 5'-phosphate oxidase family protein [Chloroflexota bacterium]